MTQFPSLSPPSPLAPIPTDRVRVRTQWAPPSDDQGRDGPTRISRPEGYGLRPGPPRHLPCLSRRSDWWVGRPSARSGPLSRPEHAPTGPRNEFWGKQTPPLSPQTPRVVSTLSTCPGPPPSHRTDHDRSGPPHGPSSLSSPTPHRTPGRTGEPRLRTLVHPPTHLPPRPPPSGPWRIRNPSPHSRDRLPLSRS